MNTIQAPETNLISLQRSKADWLASLPPNKREEFYAGLTPEALAYLPHAWGFWARPNQVWPAGPWDFWLLLTGRGWGKTKTGAQAVLEAVRRGYRRIALVARSAPDIRDTMVEGETGIMNEAAPAAKPKYIPSKRLLLFPNGAVAKTYSSEKPAQLRGPQHDFAWVDELATFEKIDWTGKPEAWSQLMFGLRLGDKPRCVITTTPRPIKVIKDLLKDAHCHAVRGTTRENLHNLAPTYIDQIVKPYEGTRLGRQELDAEILEDVEGALWTIKLIDEYRVVEPPELQRVVVAIDPAVTARATSDETGICVAAKGVDGHFYVLQDASCKMSPDGWIRRALTLHYRYSGDRIVGEVNNGGDLIESLLRTHDDNAPYRSVTASRGKAVRAEPVAALYEQGRVHHVGSIPGLENEMTTWTPDGSDFSPNRMDALVWAITELKDGNEVRLRQL